MFGMMRDLAAGHMGWAMGVNVVLLAVLLILVVALSKYTVFP
jgi:hypothetical protein